MLAVWKWQRQSAIAPAHVDFIRENISPASPDRPQIPINCTRSPYLYAQTVRFPTLSLSLLYLVTYPAMAPPAASRNTIARLMRAAQHTACPCHGCRAGTGHGHGMQAINQLRKFATPVDHVPREYAFEVCALLDVSALATHHASIRSRRPTFASVRASQKRLDLISRT